MADDAPRKQNAERDVPFETSSGRPVKALYTPADRAVADHMRDLRSSGEFTYTRGVESGRRFLAE